MDDESVTLSGVALMLACHVVSSEDVNTHLKREINSSDDKRPESEKHMEVTSVNLEDKLQVSMEPLQDADEDLEAELQGSDEERTASEDDTTDEDARSASFISIEAMSTQTSHSSVPSIDIPFEAHLLQSRGRHHTAALPFFFMADSTNIATLMSSVLYQRRVWGIHAPAVGVLVSTTDSFAKVVTGWLESGDSDNELVLLLFSVGCPAISNSFDSPW